MSYVRRSRQMCAIGQRTFIRAVALVICCAALLPAAAYAQGVTTASMTGIVKDASGGVIPGASVSAVHQPSGTNYETVTQADGRFTMPGMRVGGPYTVTAQLQGFTTEVQNNITLSLGVAQDLAFTLKVATIAETVTVVGTSDPVFSTSHTGAATAVMREDLAALPTITGRITDITRLTPQYGGSGTSPVRTIATTTSPSTARISTTPSASASRPAASATAPASRRSRSRRSSRCR